MRIKKLYKNFPELSSLDEEQKRFVNRINKKLFSIFYEELNDDDYEDLIDRISYLIGEDIDSMKEDSYYSIGLIELSKNDFNRSLEIIVHLYDILSQSNEFKQIINKAIEDVIAVSSPILGLSWIDGVFHPLGDSTLDKDLIAHSSFLLEQYPDEKKDLHNALTNYKAKSYDDVLHHCFTCIEGLTRKLLGNKKALTNNKTELLVALKADSNWSSIVNSFFNYLNENGRHGGDKRHEKKVEDVEAALYQTCLLVRMIMRKMAI